MNMDSFFKITYGLFLIGVESDGIFNGCIINTAAQATVEPPRLIATMQKANFTSGLILGKRSFSVSVLDRSCPLSLVSDFGMRSGRDVRKFDGSYKYDIDINGNPYITAGANARFAVTVEQTTDLETHWLFVCRADEAVTLSENLSMSYGDYRILKGGGSLDAPQAAPEKKYVCDVCHYEYDGDIPFEDLPDDYVCPICGVGKEHFKLV